MKRLMLTAIAACAWWGLDVKPAQAQFIYTRPQTSPFYQPPVSPYLNVLRGGALGPATGYYTLTRPQMQFGGQLQTLQSGLLSLQQQAGVLNLQQAALLSGLTTTGTPTGLATTTGSLGLTTGHPASFFNYGHYYTFPNTQGRGSGR
jgi:hypothetical protein